MSRINDKLIVNEENFFITSDFDGNSLMSKNQLGGWGWGGAYS